MDPSRNIDFTSKPLQIYTCAHAVRKKPTETVNKVIRNSSSTISEQTQQTLKLKPNISLHRQPRFPFLRKSGIIVSKMASRNRVADDPDENDDPLKNIDLSVLREIKLPPPSRTNRRNVTSRCRSSFDKIVEMMKNKSAELNPCSCKAPMPLSQADRAELEAMLHNMSSRHGDPASTPALQHNYNQLYGHCRRVRRASPPASPQENEDPLDFDVGETSPPTNHYEEKTLALPRYSPEEHPESDFVFNPVFLKSNLPDVFDFLKSTCPPPEYDLHRLDENDIFRRNEMQHYLDSPSSNWDSSSTSSGQTIAEEKLQFTFFKKRGSGVPFGHTQQSTARITNLRAQHLEDDAFWFSNN